jgi:hypothetical protein
VAINNLPSDFFKQGRRLRSWALIVTVIPIVDLVDLLVPIISRRSFGVSVIFVGFCSLIFVSMGKNFPAKSNLRKGLFALAGGFASVVIANLNRITAGFVLAQVLMDIVALVLLMLAVFYAHKESADRHNPLH